MPGGKFLLAEGLVDEAKPPIIVYASATATGKTAASLGIPGTEVVSADRFTAWDELDKGVAKQSTAERARRPHHLINLFHLAELAGQPIPPGHIHIGSRNPSHIMQNLAYQAIDSISARGNIPVIVGGSLDTITALTLGFTHKDSPELLERYAAMDENELREFCRDWGLNYTDHHPMPLDAIRQKLHAEFTARKERPLANVYPIAIRHRTSDLAHRVMQRLDQMWQEGLPEEVARLSETYGWVGPLRDAIGYKEFMPGPDGEKPKPNQVWRAILANTIGYIAAQTERLNESAPIHWTDSPEEAAEVGRWVADQYRSHGRLASRLLIYPYTFDGTKPWAQPPEPPFSTEPTEYAIRWEIEHAWPGPGA